MTSLSFQKYTKELTKRVRTQQAKPIPTITETSQRARLPYGLALLLPYIIESTALYEYFKRGRNITKHVRVLQNFYPTFFYEIILQYPLRKDRPSCFGICGAGRTHLGLGPAGGCPQLHRTQEPLPIQGSGSSAVEPDQCHRVFKEEAVACHSHLPSFFHALTLLCPGQCLGK